MEENKKEEINTQDTTQEKVIENTQERPQKKHGKLRMMLVLLFIAVFAVIMYISLRGSYLEYKELGENFIPVFYTNLTYKAAIMGINFIILYFILYFTNKGIKKGLKVFFDKEKRKLPHLPNKSLALVISAIVSVIVGIIFTD